MCHIQILNAQNAADAGAFRDFGQRIALGNAGIFYSDSIDMIERVARDRAAKAFLERAYHVAGLDRWAERERIAAEMEAGLTGGVWAKSSGTFADKLAQLDAWVLELLSEKEIEI